MEEIILFVIGIILQALVEAFFLACAYVIDFLITRVGRILAHRELRKWAIWTVHIVVGIGFVYFFGLRHGWF